MAIVAFVLSAEHNIDKVEKSRQACLQCMPLEDAQNEIRPLSQGRQTRGLAERLVAGSSSLIRRGDSVN